MPPNNNYNISSESYLQKWSQSQKMANRIEKAKINAYLAEQLQKKRAKESNAALKRLEKGINNLEKEMKKRKGLKWF
jgi:hypothetical protein